VRKSAWDLALFVRQLPEGNGARCALNHSPYSRRQCAGIKSYISKLAKVEILAEHEAMGIEAIEAFKLLRFD
jgi:hypothetical protein